MLYRTSKDHKFWLIGAVLCSTATTPALGQVFPEDEVTDDIEEVIVLGSRTRTVRQAHELAVPVEVYDAYALDHSGEIDLGAALTKLSPSFNYSRNSLGDGGLLHPATLRAMSPDQTLVLVNGKRRHSMAWLRVLDGVVGWGTGGTDLRAIPSAAIGGVEILRDGASTQYGSDAIAGVINLQLKEHDDGGEVALHGGTTFGDKGGRVGASFNVGMPIAESGGFLNITGEWHDEAAIKRNGGNGGHDPDYQDELITHSSPEYDNVALFVNSEIPLADVANFYAFGGYSKRSGQSSGAYRFAYEYWEGIETGSDTWDEVLPAFINFHERNNHVVHPNGFLPLEESEISDFSIAGGLRSAWRTWEFDLGLTYGTNEFIFDVSNSINASIGAEYLAENPNATMDDIRRNAGPTSGNSGGLEFNQLSLNFDTRSDFSVDSSGISAAAFGFEYRKEDYRQIAGDEASWSCGADGDDDAGGDFAAFAVGPDGKPIADTVASCGFQGYPGYSPLNAALSEDDRNSQAAYGEVAYQAGDSITLDGAVRWENYSDAGDNLSGKLSGIALLSEGVALRAAVSTGFRAPSLSQRRFNSIVIAGSGEGLTTTFLANEGHAIARALGINELGHETSTSYSVGFIIEHEEFMFSVDAYNIAVEDRIVRSKGIGCATIAVSEEVPASTAALFAVCDGAAVSNAAAFFNGIDTENRGVDISAGWNMETGNGTLGLFLNGNFNKTEITEEHLPANAPSKLPGETPAGEKVLFETDFSAYFGGWAQSVFLKGQPSRQVNFTADWAFGNLGLLARVNYYGSTEQNPVNTGAIEVEPASTIDLEFRFTAGSFLSEIGINNVLDELPTALDKLHRSNVLWGTAYPLDNPIGLGGRYLYARVRYDFDL